MLHRDLHLDFNHAISPKIPQGVSDAEFEAIAPALNQVQRALHAMQEIGQVQFLNLPFLEDTLREVEVRAREISERFDTMVVLGIGGSGLGAKAIAGALHDSAFPGIQKDATKRLIVLDTLDPDYFKSLLDGLDFKRTLFNVVSKSGNTVETMAQFLIFYEKLKKQVGDSFRDHIVMTTDAKKGTLRQLCAQEGFASFEILPGVGGRFSALSPVGLFPAAFLGISIQEMAEGAARMIKRCAVEDLWINPAAMFAAVTYLLAEKHGRRQLVLFNYAESFQASVEWFRQLWAESLGKLQDLQGREIRAGITPVHSSGPRDQHSQVQLYVDGPADKMFMFWNLENFGADYAVPRLYAETDSLGYLGGLKLSEILFAEMQATEQSLDDAGAPSFRMNLPARDPYTLGQLFYLLEIATVYCGGLLNVNPYDQPGVERGKQYLYGKLGRKGFEEFGATLARRLKDKRYVV